MIVLRLVLGLVIAGNSFVVAMNQIRGHAHSVLLILGLAELIAAVLFLIPQTVRLGGISLIVVFAAAAVFHVLHGEYDISFLAIYAAAAFAVIYPGRRA